MPHFEKMLYDQAGLLRAYLHGWQVTGRPGLPRVVEGIVAYVARDLTAPEGGVYSAEDADSEGVEGRFYVWTPDQVAAAVDAASTRDGSPPTWRRRSSDWFGVTADGNFEGATILRRPVGAPLRGSETVEAGRRRSCSAPGPAGCGPGSTTRCSPSGTPCTRSALAEAAAATGNPAGRTPPWASASSSWTTCVDADGRWLRSWQPEGGARHLAYAADYAWLVDCFTRLAELTGQAVWTERAVATADGLLALFHDDEGGGFFTTGHDAETAHRPHQGRLRRRHPVGQRRGRPWRWPVSAR